MEEQREVMARWVYILLGLLFVAIGFLGAFLPVLPSTIFFIFAVYFFGKSSERLETWMLKHPRIGPTLRGWKEQGAISLEGKLAATLGMIVGLSVATLAPMPGWAKGLSAIIIGLSGLYVATRPNLEEESEDKKE